MSWWQRQVVKLKATRDNGCLFRSQVAKQFLLRKSHLAVSSTELTWKDNCNLGRTQFLSRHQEEEAIQAVEQSGCCLLLLWLFFLLLGVDVQHAAGFPICDLLLLLSYYHFTLLRLCQDIALAVYVSAFITLFVFSLAGEMTRMYQ